MSSSSSSVAATTAAALSPVTAEQLAIDAAREKGILVGREVTDLNAVLASFFSVQPKDMPKPLLQLTTQYAVTIPEPVLICKALFQSWLSDQNTRQEIVNDTAILGEKLTRGDLSRVFIDIDYDADGSLNNDFFNSLLGKVRATFFKNMAQWDDTTLPAVVDFTWYERGRELIRRLAPSEIITREMERASSEAAEERHEATINQLLSSASVEQPVYGVSIQYRPDHTRGANADRVNGQSRLEIRTHEAAVSSLSALKTEGRVVFEAAIAKPAFPNELMQPYPAEAESGSLPL